MGRMILSRIAYRRHGELAHFMQREPGEGDCVGLLPNEVGGTIHDGEQNKMYYRYPVYRIWLLYACQILLSREQRIQGRSHCICTL